MKTIKSISLIILTATMFSSCELHGPRTVIGTGDIQSMEVAVERFTGVSVNGSCDVKIVTGEEQQVILKAQNEILDVMSYQVRSGILEIGFKPDYNVKPRKGVYAEIVVPAIDFVGISGAGDFTLSGDEQESLTIRIEGTGDVSALDMEVRDCFIMIDGAGNCQVNVSRLLDIQINGVGHVSYAGSPDLSYDIDGVGNVNPINP